MARYRHVLLRNRLLRQSHGFEGLRSLLEQPKASDLRILDPEHERGSRDHFDPVAPPHVDGTWDHDLGVNVGEAVRLHLDILKR